MKILHLISGGDNGGAKTHLFSLFDKLKYKADIRVACLIEGVFYKEIQSRGVDNVLFKQKNRFDLSVVDKIATMINDEGFDILHVHGARANFVAEFIMRKINIPTVTTIHSDYLLDFDEPIKKLFFTPLNKHAIKKIPYRIAVSNNFKDMMIERGFRANSIYTVYNGMDFSNVPKEVMPKAEYARAHGFEYDESKTYIGIAARFDAVKGVDVFVKAGIELLSRNDNAEFLIAGDGVEREKLEELVKASGFEEKIHFLGYEKNIYDFWNIIDINCLTSLCESFPYSMLEGAAMGKPMVASRVGGIPSLVIDDETGFLFESGNYKEMAEKLDVLVKNPALILKMGQNIKEYALSSFSNERFAQTHIEIYESIIRDFYEQKKYDFVISGYYGFRNNGDDALLMSIAEDVKKEKGDVRIAVLSNRPKETTKIYRIDAIHRLNIPRVLSVFRNTKVLIFGAGSLLQDETSSKSLWYYLLILKLAKKCNMKIMQFANGFGPVNRDYNRRITAKVVNECVDLITTRDKASFDRMKELGIDREMYLTADPAMLLNGVSERKLSRMLNREAVPKGEYITLSVREWKKNPGNFEQMLAAAVSDFARRYDLNVLIIPMQYPHDVDISKRIKNLIGDRAFVFENGISIKETIGVIKNSRLNVAMRLHSIIYSVSQGIKTVALRYDPKIDGFMEYAGLNFICDVEDINCDKLLEVVEMAYSEEIENDYKELREKARQNTIKAVELLEN